ncbi:alpha/beta fold hydrolase [Nocardia acidivorans]|uniref:alpha/beta fold hydrolase n=1 Tax=Nocardia acidivorans TaxID=404580 RepID=UPI00082C2B53|nr:alpha/beta hydrolase [Nocardia acidivorans]
MRLDEWIAGGEHIRLGGHDIFHRQDGPVDGRPVTLVHGFPTSSHDWAPIAPALAESGCRVTTLDLLGFGASAKPVGHDYRITEQASIVEELWQRLDIDETALVSHDYGVSVAQELLHRNAPRITSAAFFNGGLYPDLHRPIRIQQLLHGPAGSLLQHLSTERMYRRSLKEVFGRPVSDADLHDMWLATTMNHGKRVQHRLLRYIDERRAHADRWRTAVETYPGPVQFIWGPADPVSGAHVLPRLRDRLPKAHFLILDQAPPTGHYPQVENPTPVAEALVTFLR